MNVTGYSLGESWNVIHTTFLEPASLADAMADIAEEIAALAETGRVFRTITLDIEED